MFFFTELSNLLPFPIPFASRLIGSFLTSFMLMLIVGKPFIALAVRIFPANARIATPLNHQGKNGIPTMGGLLIIAVIMVGAMLWCNVRKPQVWCQLFVLAVFGLLGAIDDWYKISCARGVSVKTKFLGQLIAGLASIGLLMFYADIAPVVQLPFGMLLPIPFLFVLWALFLIVGCSNAVNITDGLDGLATQVLIPTFFVLSLLAYVARVAGESVVPAGAELGVLAALVGGALVGFLWYNAYPAQLFMGDAGALALGALLATMSLALDFVWFLPLSAVICVIETLSALVQIGSLKLRGKKIFRLAPIHHHFELGGWHEQKITTRAAIISWVLSLVALSLYRS